MACKSAAEEAGTEATNPNKQTPGRKPQKTRTQMNKHNEYCKKSRAKIKRRRKELEQVEIKYLEMEPEFKRIRTEYERLKIESKAENERMKRELEKANFEVSCKEKEMQALRRDLQKLRQIQTEQELILENYFLSPINEHVGQVSGTSATVVHDANQLPRLGATGTDNIHSSLADIYQSMGLGASSATNHGLPFVSDASDNHDNGVLVNSDVGSPSGANQYLPAFDAPNIYDNLVAGVLRNSAADSSSQTNHNPSIWFDAANNPENIHDLFNHGSASGFPF